MIFSQLQSSVVDSVFFRQSKNEKAIKVYLAILRHASYKKSGNNFLPIDKGELLTSQQKLCDLCGYTNSKGPQRLVIIKALAKLEKEGLISITTTPTYTKIKVLQFNGDKAEPIKKAKKIKPILDERYSSIKIDEQGMHCPNVSPEEINQEFSKRYNIKEDKVKELIKKSIRKAQLKIEGNKQTNTRDTFGIEYINSYINKCVENDLRGLDLTQQ